MTNYKELVITKNLHSRLYWRSWKIWNLMKQKSSYSKWYFNWPMEWFFGGKCKCLSPNCSFQELYKDISGQMVWAKDNHFRSGNYDLKNRNCEHLANMIVYGINYSEQVENNKVKLASSVGGATGAYVGGVTALGAANVAGSIVLVPFTGGLSLLWGAASAGLAGAGGAAAIAAADDIAGGETNNGKGSTIKLTNEIRESDGKLGKKFDFETDRYERQYLQEVPSKENCRII